MASTVYRNRTNRNPTDRSCAYRHPLYRNRAYRDPTCRNPTDRNRPVPLQYRTVLTMEQRREHLVAVSARPAPCALRPSPLLAPAFCLLPSASSSLLLRRRTARPCQLPGQRAEESTQPLGDAARHLPSALSLACLLARIETAPRRHGEVRRRAPIERIGRGGATEAVVVVLKNQTPRIDDASRPGEAVGVAERDVTSYATAPNGGRAPLPRRRPPPRDPRIAGGSRMATDAADAEWAERGSWLRRAGRRGADPPPPGELGSPFRSHRVRLSPAMVNTAQDGPPRAVQHADFRTGVAVPVTGGA